jgi:hypothetical protein
MAQKANLTSVDKYEADRREAERLDLEKHARLEAGLIDPVSATQPSPPVEHQHPEKYFEEQVIFCRYQGIQGQGTLPQRWFAALDVS